MTSARPTPTIALVAVPGPGAEGPGVAARRLADLLLRLRRDDRNRYSSFVERAVRIPTKPARVNPRSAPNVAPDLPRSLFAEQHPFLRTQLEYAGAAARDREEDSPDHQLMRAQLADYRSASEPYETILLEGDRLADCANGGAPEPLAHVNVYELRWADLTGPRSGARRIFSELYQLFVHIAHLGRTAVDHARLEQATSPAWRLYGGAHTWAVRLLTLVIPAIVVSMLATLVGVGAVGLVTGRWGVIAGQLVLAAWVIFAGAAVYWSFRAYDRLRPGARWIGVGAYVATGVPLALIAARARNDEELIDGTLRVFQAEAIAAAVAWDGLYLTGLAAAVFAVVACGRLRGSASARAWRAARTAAATLAVATTSMLVATFVVWAALHRIVGDALPTGSVSAIVPAFERNAHSVPGFFERVLEVTAGAGVPLLLLIATGLAAIAMIALAPSLNRELRPPRAGESFDEQANGAPSPSHNEPVDTDLRWAAWELLRRDDDASQRLGGRLSRGSQVLTVLVVALYASVFVVAPVVSTIQIVTHVAAIERLHALGDTIVLVVGSALAAVALALVALRARFPRATLGLAPLVDVVLAVDSYLRTHPRDATPRAKVAERYTSLLRYLCRWRDGSGRPYDAIVLVAQSQGAAITADLLSFVQREEDPELESIRRPLANGVPGAAGRRLFLFTTGAPLRQLYSAWFPHLFGWVRGDVGDGVARPLPAVPREPWMLLPRLEDGHRVYAPAIPDNAAPDPYAMGLTRWVNAYRSGDYVGRALWRHTVDGCDWLYRAAPADAATRFAGDVPPVTYVSEDAHRSRRELCIGAGAHTHYWDATAKAIAVELDLLLTDATRFAVRVSNDTGAPTGGMES